MGIKHPKIAANIARVVLCVLLLRLSARILMSAPYRVVIGLEVHVQLLTQTKLFCGCRTTFGLPPNSATCPVCIGLPGVMPVMNRRAFELALRGALALGCSIARFTKWDRKNYYYPDLPKNYQTSQYDLPLGGEGAVTIQTSQGAKRIGIIRAHLEEDAGKMLHDEKGGGSDSLVDLNRAGTPLLEIVGKPELSTPEEARLFLEEVRLLMRDSGVSDCEMQEGSLRCDANVNIHVPHAQGYEATPIVEIKNLNSFRFLEMAVAYEAEQHWQRFQSDRSYRMGKQPKATVGWDEGRKRTTLQRTKEEVADYRFFPEPDLVPVIVDDAWLARATAEVGETPAAMRTRLAEQYGLSAYDIEVITSRGRAMTAYFEKVAKGCGDAKAASNWVTNQVLSALKEGEGDITTFGVDAERLGELIAKQKALSLPKQTAGELFGLMRADGLDVGQAMEKLGVRPLADNAALVEVVRRAMAGNAKAVADYKAGKRAAANAIKGAIMKETKGGAPADVVQKILEEELAKE
jgi:aspartyl-tRNA(Asn)/glutamyl-tRNA(Gln) amidotransferase subunit B